MKSAAAILFCGHDIHIGPAAIPSRDPKDVGRGCAGVA